ncbi:MAG: hypothetical protein RR317_06870 [Bilophila sp.]
MTLSLLILPGCADLNISNPFEKTSDVNEVYFDQFPDVPLPRDMTVDSSRSLVSVAQDGSKTGLLTVEGRVDKPSLANAMILNMNRQSWNLRAATTGAKTMHLYEKDNRYAIVYFYEQTTSVAMEIWIATRLEDGVIPTGNGGAGMNAGSNPSFKLAPAATGNTSGGGVHQQGLSQ